MFGITDLEEMYRSPQSLWPESVVLAKVTTVCPIPLFEVVLLMKVSKHWLMYPLSKDG